MGESSSMRFSYSGPLYHINSGHHWGLGSLSERIFRLPKQKKLTAHTKIVLILSAVLLFSTALFILLMEKNHAMAGLPLGQRINESCSCQLTPDPLASQPLI